MSDPSHKPSIRERLFGRRPQSVAESHKELRFTRARQASQFFLLSAFFTILSIGSLCALYTCWGPDDLAFPKRVIICLLPLLPAYVFLRIALHCIRHPYILLSPIGIEIFPFFKPEKNLQVLFWSDIHSAECSPKKLSLHFSAEQSSGVILTLRPLSKQQISLLHTAITARTTSN